MGVGPVDIATGDRDGPGSSLMEGSEVIGLVGSQGPSLVRVSSVKKTDG